MVHESIPITADDSSQVGQARRRAAAAAKAMGFDDVRAGELSIVVTEAARNIALHAGSGQIILAPWTIQNWTIESGAVQSKPDSTGGFDTGVFELSGVDVFALDRGPGIFDLQLAEEDGYSTAGTAGQGLGAIRRLAASMDIDSTPGAGTVLFARVLRQASKPEPPSSSLPSSIINARGLLFGALAIPFSGEVHCGDAWSSIYFPQRSVHIMADGLGHGPMASEASSEAVRVFKGCSQHAPERILKEIHAALGKTRGAAVSVAEILLNEKILNYAGAGNIAGAIYTGEKSKSMVSMNGTVGHSVSKFLQFSYPWERNSLLIMHSDGLGTRTNVEQYSGLTSRHPALIAAVLYRDFARGRDDASVLVTRT